MLQTPRWRRSRGPCAQGLTRRGGPATSARRCVALIVALHVASRDRTRHSPRFCKLRGLITPGKGPDSSPTPDGDARRGVLARRTGHGDTRSLRSTVLRVRATNLALTELMCTNVG